MSQLLPERRSGRRASARARCAGRAAAPGASNYRVMLPDRVDTEKVDAKLSDGVLTVRVPKAEQSQRRKIEVRS